MREIPLSRGLVTLVNEAALKYYGEYACLNNVEKENK